MRLRVAFAERKHHMNFAINPLAAIGVLASTAATDAAYVFFNAAVSSRRRVWAANWSAVWYMLSGTSKNSCFSRPVRI